MQTQCTQAIEAINAECTAITLPKLIQRITAECEQVAAEVNAMAPDAWLNAHGRALLNREQELNTTLVVLWDLAWQQMRIAEPMPVAG